MEAYKEENKEDMESINQMEQDEDGKMPENEDVCETPDGEEDAEWMQEDTDAHDPSGQEASEDGDAAQDGDGTKTSDGTEEKKGQGEGKKGFFKKNKKKDKKDEKIEELTDQVKRQMAEFDNFRKRTEKEKSQMYEIGAKSIIEKVLPIVDNFERGLAAVPQENQDDAFVDGMNLIYKQMLTMLEEADVRPIEAVGKEFDPNLHNAVMQMESEEYESGIVAQELQKGYMYRDSVVRHSMVAVVG